MVRVESLPIEYGIGVRLSYTEGENILSLVNNDMALARAKFDNIPSSNVICNGYVSDLFVYSEIMSLNESPMPDYQNEDSDAQRLAKTNAFQWDSYRYHLMLYTTTKRIINSPLDWIPIGKFSLKNPAGYPYTRNDPFRLLTRNLVRSLGEDCKIGYSIQNAGYGTLQANDLVCIDGGWKQEVVWTSPDYAPFQVLGTVQNVTQYNVSDLITVGATTRTQLLASNQNRASALLTNQSANIIYLSFTDVTPTSTNNAGTIAANSSFAVPASHKGGIWAIAGAGAANRVRTNEVYNG